MQYRCVKCKNEHNPGECNNYNLGIKQVYCVNCNNFGHPASYRGCPRLKEIKLKIHNKNKQENKKYGNINTSSIVKPGMQRLPEKGNPKIKSKEYKNRNG